MKSNIALSLGLAAILGLAVAMPASAQTATTAPATAAKPAAAATAAAKPMTHYYISLKAKGPGCDVVTVKPTSKLMVGKHSFKTEADAKKALAADKACKA